MENRSKSARAFIDAAGELFAMRGIDGVSVKAIADSAGIDASMIKYHFGSKDGLVWAVIENAVEPWSRDNLREYYERNRGLLETRDGQTVFVTGMVEQLFRVLHAEGESGWGKSFVLQLLQRPHPLRKKLIDTYIKPGIRCFYEACRKITGNDDFESAFCWYLMTICPIYMYSGSPGMIDEFHPEGGVSHGFDRRLLWFTTRQLLIGLGLAR